MIGLGNEGELFKLADKGQQRREVVDGAYPVTVAGVVGHGGEGENRGVNRKEVHRLRAKHFRAGIPILKAAEKPESLRQQKSTEYTVFLAFKIVGVARITRQTVLNVQPQSTLILQLVVSLP